MSTSSWRTVNRCASSLARSSTSPTSRSSRSASIATTESDSASASGSSIRPSRSASTWPRIAVSGVRSSCETDIRKLRSCSSASASREAIWRKRSARWLTSPLPGTSGTAMSYLPSAIRSAAVREREHRLGDPAREVPGERAGDEQPDAERDEQELEQREPAVRQLGLLLGDDQRAEVLPLELERLPDRLEGLALARRGELEGDHLLAVDERLPLVADLLAVELAQAGAVPEEDRRADVVEAGAGRLLELGAGEVGRRAALVDRAERGRLVELGQPLRLPPELGERLRAEVILEELDGDRGRDDPRERDARQEERRQAEAQGRHRSYAAGAGSASFDGRDLVPHAPHGHDRRGVAELAAELPDVDVDGARVAREGVAPDALEQLVAREDEARGGRAAPRGGRTPSGRAGSPPRRREPRGARHRPRGRRGGSASTRSRGAPGRRGAGSTSRGRRARAG